MFKFSIRKTIITSMVFLLSAILPISSFAAFQCSVKVIKVLVYSTGTVNIMHSGRNDYTVICNLNFNSGDVTPVTCAMWTAMLQSIKKKDGTAVFYFNEDGTCATMNIYEKAPIPIYIGDV
ncbi:hypothetical protein SAMN03097694_2349 [Janthinobacterium lividum]|uniref:Secreted protein n=1 Tax=Janthinobacterium lividum TaxID=29581 RepID=A0AB38C7C9_9BURK|nr:hypothetical protein SAMN03097694_2349 [Janthinobacterium lividum]